MTSHSVIESGVSYGGVLDELVRGDWVDPKTDQQQTISSDDIVIVKNLDGAEADLISALHKGKRLAVVCDPFTYQALGQRIIKRLRFLGQIDEFIWKSPRCTPEGAEEVQKACAEADVLIAVGSGTINDTVKYATYLDGREYSVFATSPMNAYTTSTASVSCDGFKSSIPCHSARGIFFDLDVIAKCPPRLISAAFADVICRTTAQVDWLMSHLLFDTPYTDTPYTLLAYDEGTMLAEAENMLSGDIEALATLTRISAIMGLGTSFTGSTHCGSMAEHMISHFIDMFSGNNHPGTSHGEQVGVATLTMSHLQNRVLNADQPPTVSPTVIPEDEINTKFSGHATMMIEQTQQKALTERESDRINQLFADNWEGFVSPLREIMLPFEQINVAMGKAKCQKTGKELGLTSEFYAQAVRYSRFIRDRFTTLDLADEAGLLEEFAASSI